MTLNRLLSVLVISSLVLSATILVLQVYQSRAQNEARGQLNSIMNVQTSIDVLRSRLWLLQQQGDETSLTEGRRASQQLRNTLEANTLSDVSQGAVPNLRHMQKAVDRLLMLAENNLSQSEHPSSDPSHRLIASRLNMILLSMSEEVLVLHQRVQAHVNEIQAQLTIWAGVVMVLLSLSLVFLMLLFRHRLQGGLNTLIAGIRKVQQGALDGEVKAKYDDELQIIAGELSDMKLKLSETMVSRDALQREVDEQTRQLKAQHDELRRVANTDGLTGLLNRRAFESQVTLAMTRAEVSGNHAALLFIDLNDFKAVNDTFGHEAGDLLLNAVADRLRQVVRATDLVARLGGDEFIVWLNLLGDNGNVDTAVSRIRAIIDSPILFHGEPISIKLSVGVALFPEHGRKLDELMKKADEAMYKAKKEKYSNTLTFNIFQEV